MLARSLRARVRLMAGSLVSALSLSILRASRPA